MKVKGGKIQDSEVEAPATSRESTFEIPLNGSRQQARRAESRLSTGEVEANDDMVRSVGGRSTFVSAH